MTTLAEKKGFIWFDGKIVNSEEANVHVLTHTLHYGLGVFEGVRAYETPEGTKIFRLNDHTERLFSSAQAVDLEIPFSKEEINQAQIEIVKLNNLKEAYIRPMCFYGSGSLGLRADDLKVHTIVAAWEWASYMAPEVSEKGIKVFYVSNRYSEQLESTINNLKRLGFPNVSESTVLLRSDSRSKSKRRNSISDGHEVIMLIGDNLSDFNDEFEVKISEERINYTNEMRGNFGTKLIVLPNPNYGDWESNGLFGGESFDNIEKDSIRKSNIKSY